MKIFIVQLYREVNNGDTDEKGILQDTIGFPAVFDSARSAAKVGNLVKNTLNTNMIATWDYRIVEGEMYE